MADVLVNALTTIATEPESTDSMVVVNRNTNEGKIIDYNLLADVILNKIASKQFSGLTTTSKLLTGAINELDSDVSSLNSRLDIVAMAYTTVTATTASSGIILTSIPASKFIRAICPTGQPYYLLAREAQSGNIAIKVIDESLSVVTNTNVIMNILYYAN